MRFRPALFLLLVLFPFAAARAVHSSEEGRIADDLTSAAQSGEAVWLEANGVRFLALFDETSWPNRRGGVLFLHDRDGHPDRRPFPYALRRELPRRGWAVLVLQVPDGAPGDAAERLKAGLAWLEARKIAPLALIGQGAGGREAVRYLAGRQDNPAGRPSCSAKPSEDRRDERCGQETEPRALALLDVAEPEELPARQRFLEALGVLRLPVADIFCLREAEASLASAQRATASRLNIEYRQSALYDAHLRMEDVETLVVSRVSGWLARTLQKASPGPSAPPARP